MVEEQLKDIIGWDVANWSQALQYWEKFLPEKKSNDTTALELGSGFNGGLSLWLALKGIKTTCSGYNPNYNGASDQAKAIHEKYGVSDLIEYQEINATEIPYQAKYDIICYKSMLGGIVRKGDMEIAEKVVEEIFSALKPGGVLMFAENTSATFVHKVMRNRFSTGKSGWRYFTIDELNMLHRQFSTFEYRTYGFLGCFGINEQQRRMLGNLDQTIFTKLPEQWNYFLAGAAIK